MRAGHSKGVCALSGRSSSECFINRELSLLEFNQRVLALALDESIPLLERLKFLCITSNNLDEFFEIRVAGLKQLLELGSAPVAPDGMSVTEQLAAIHTRASALVAEQYRCLNEILLPALQSAGVCVLAREDWSTATELWLTEYFEQQVEPVLSPLGLDPARPFPRVQNKSLNFIVRLRGKDAFGRDSELAVVQVPRSLPRVVPVAIDPMQRSFVLLSTIVHAFAQRLFSGIEVLGCYQFRLTRNSELFVDEEEIDDLRHALEGELAQRRYGAAVRLETSSDCPAVMTQFLLKQFALSEGDCYRVPGPVNLNRLAALYELIGRVDLKYPIFTPGLPQRLTGVFDLFAAIRQGEILLHHPFQSFAPVLDLVRRNLRPRGANGARERDHRRRRPRHHHAAGQCRSDHRQHHPRA